MAVIEDTIRTVKETIFRHRMIEPGDLIIVGVSGGPDSVCLLDILHQCMALLDIGLVVAQYNHGLRPMEDERDTEFVREIAVSRKLPFETEKSCFCDAMNMGSIEERARDARYAFLRRLKINLGAQKIALGHHLNDQAETVIMRLLRGSGLTGLAGIPPRREDSIIRPLIRLKRAEIESYLRARQISHVTDRSNYETRYLRNRIRLELMPFLLKFQPRLVEHLGETAGILREENDYLDRQAWEWMDRETETNSHGDVLIRVSAFMTMHEALRNRVGRHVLMRVKKNLLKIQRSHIQSIYELARSERPQASVHLPDGVRVKKRYHKLIFTGRPEPEFKEFQYIVDRPGTLSLVQIGLCLDLFEMGADALPHDLGRSKETAYIDAEKIEYPLVIRNFRPGDTFIPYGMKGHKKIKDFFIDLKIPSEMRASTPILISQGTPVWICGLRMDDRFKVTSATRKILKMTLSPGPVISSK
jgi:tRNA(Ile)-lysidine synthase